MAVQNQQSLFQELGLTAPNAQAIIKQFQQKHVQDNRQGGASNASVFANLGRELGSQAGAGIATLGGAAVGGARSFFGKNKGQTFKQGLTGGVQGVQDRQLAEATGQTVEQIKTNRTIRSEISQLNLPTSGDSFKDQEALLKEIIKIANKNGDTALIGKANHKLMALRKEEAELVKLETGNDAAIRDNELNAETDSTGRTIILQGDSMEDPHSKAIQNDDGTWTVMRPDSTVRQNVSGLEITFVDPSDIAARKASMRDRFFETPDGAMKNALNMNGMNTAALKKTRDHVASMGEQAGIIADMTDSLLNMYDPDLAFDLSSKALIGADRIATLAGNVSEVLTRANEKELPGWAITWGGKKVTVAQQIAKATNSSILESYMDEEGLDFSQILPPHIKADSREAQLFLSNIMQMAYLDARLQEPSNRGLSDNDIKAALTRIGVNTADPVVFARRQLQILTRLKGKMSNLGVEFSKTAQVTKAALRTFVYQPEATDQISAALQRAEDRVNKFLGSQQVRTSLEALSEADLDEQIAAEQAKAK